MNSKITFLGTAGDIFTAGKQVRASGGVVLKAGDNQIHLDPGPGALVRAMQNNVNLRENNIIVATNNNLLNCNDVNAVIDASTYGGFDKKGVLIAAKSVINGTEEENPWLSRSQSNNVEKIIAASPGQRIGIEEIEINIMPAISDDPDGIGLKIITNDFILGYSSDTKYSKDLAKKYRGCDILILNVTFPKGDKSGNHLNSEDAVKFIREVNPRLAIIKNFGIYVIKSDPLYESREIQKQTGVKVVAAKDGMSLTPDSYSAESRQKRLNVFKQEEADEGPGEKEDQEIFSEEEKEDKTEVLMIKKDDQEGKKEEKTDKQEHLDFSSGS